MQEPQEGLSGLFPVRHHRASVRAGPTLQGNVSYVVSHKDEDSDFFPMVTLDIKSSVRHGVGNVRTIPETKSRDIVEFFEVDSFEVVESRSVDPI